MDVLDLPRRPPVDARCRFSAFDVRGLDLCDTILGVDALPLRTLAVRFFLTPAELRDLVFVSFFSAETSR